MPELVNLTPFPNFRYYSRDNQDREFGIVIVKATYEFDASGNLVEAEEQAPMMFTDKCHGEVNVTSLWHPSDLVPNKPATDLIINATAHAVGGKPVPAWLCGIKISNGATELFSKQLRVTGPRQWNSVWKRRLTDREASDWQRHRKLFDRWELSEPDPIAAVPLHYEYAFGGEIPTGSNDDGTPIFDTDHYNPLGRGKINQDWTDLTKPVAAPQIEAPDDPINEPYKVYRPQGFGPIPPAWLPRRPLGGTYDQDWQDNVWPAWPADYSFAYHNSAHPDLHIKPYLRGHEQIVVTGLTAGVEELAFALPGEQMLVDFVREDGTIEREQFVLDTVFLDIAAPRRRDWRIYLSWRVNFEPDMFEQAIIHRRRLSQAPLDQQTKATEDMAI
ncbi:DUF2169 family type VI secretion system accessory protein [Agrobacterium vitis]|uniref:DUF2169 family type VI secretion system accessory protein n=1 Tax=Agrobacterium vitis TaxID=373 RepID=UPI003D2E6013